MQHRCVTLVSTICPSRQHQQAICIYCSRPVSGETNLLQSLSWTLFSILVRLSSVCNNVIVHVHYIPSNTCLCVCLFISLSFVLCVCVCVCLSVTFAGPSCLRSSFVFVWQYIIGTGLCLFVHPSVTRRYSLNISTIFTARRICIARTVP